MPHLYTTSETQMVLPPWSSSLKSTWSVTKYHDRAMLYIYLNLPLSVLVMQFMQLNLESNMLISRVALSIVLAGIQSLQLTISMVRRDFRILSDGHSSVPYPDATTSRSLIVVRAKLYMVIT